jgi:hypothetical protein
MTSQAQAAAPLPKVCGLAFLGFGWIAESGRLQTFPAKMA